VDQEKVDLVIRGGTVVSPSSSIKADVAISGQKNFGCFISRDFA